MAGLRAGDARARRRVVEYLETAGATRADAAITYPHADSARDRDTVRRLVAYGALVEAGEGRYWLDRARWAAFRKDALADVLGAVAVAGFAAAGLLALS